MGDEKEIDTWDKIVYMVKGIFLLGLSFGMASPPELPQLIESDSAARSSGEGDEQEEQEEQEGSDEIVK